MPEASRRDASHFFLDSPAEYSYISPPRTADWGPTNYSLPIGYPIVEVFVFGGWMFVEVRCTLLFLKLPRQCSPTMTAHFFLMTNGIHNI